MKHVKDELIIAYIEGELGKEEMMRVEEHLKVCEICRDNYKAYVSLIHQLEEIPPVSAPRELDARVMRRIYHPAPLLGAFAFSAFAILTIFALIEWGSYFIRWIIERVELNSLVVSTIKFFGLLMKFYMLTVSLFDPVMVAGVMVIFSIMMAIVLRRRLEGYAGSIN